MLKECEIMLKENDLIKNNLPFLSCLKRVELEKHEVFNTELQLGGLKLFKIAEITYEDKSPRYEALENVFASIRITGISLVYLIIGNKKEVNFYFGVAEDTLTEGEMGIDEVASAVLVPSLQGNFRGSKISSVDSKEIDVIKEYIKSDGLKFACIEGVPGVIKDDEKKDFQGIDRLVDTMRGDEFGLMIIAKPITNQEEIDTLEIYLDKIYQQISFLAKQQCQLGENKSESETKGVTEGKNWGTTDSKQLSSGHSKTQTESKTDGYGSGGKKTTNHSKTEGENYTTNRSESTTHQKTGGSSWQGSFQKGDQSGSSHTFSFEAINKRLQEWVKYLDEVIYPRLDCAKGKGMFITSTLLFAPDKVILNKLSNVLQAILQGEIGNKIPLRMCLLEKGSNCLKALQNFQQPLLKIDANTDLNDYYSMFIQSKCLCMENGDKKGFYAGNWTSTIELAKMASVPQKEVVGLRLREEVEFGLNIDKDFQNEDKLHIGNLVQSGWETDIPVFLKKSELDRHIFVAGVTGSGKTTSCLSLLCAAKRPFLVIEPAKTEYRVLFHDNRFRDKLLIFTLGDDRVAPFRLNPLEFMDGETIPARVDMIMASISAAFDMEAAIPQLIEAALYESYEKYGWDIKTNRNSFYEDPFAEGVYAFPTLQDILDIIPKIVKQQEFGERLGGEYLGSIRARLQSLLVGAKGLMLNCRRSVNFEDLLEKNVIIELEEIRNGAEKSLIIGFILSNLLVAIKRKFKNNGNKKIKHITLVEEAHRLMSKFEPGDNPNKKHAVETFANMLAEIRKYGESIIIADQIPNKLTPEVLKNTNIKIVHRLFALDDKNAMGATMALSKEQATFLSNLEIGNAVMFSGSWPKAIHVRVKNIFDTSSEEIISDEELHNNILNYYATTYKRGVFPGLEILEKEPTLQEFKNYISYIQNVDLANIFTLRTMNETGFNRYIVEKIIEAKDKCGESVLVAALVSLYLIPNNIEEVRNAVREYINTRLKFEEMSIEYGNLLRNEILRRINE